MSKELALEIKVDSPMHKALTHRYSKGLPFLYDGKSYKLTDAINQGWGVILAKFEEIL